MSRELIYPFQFARVAITPVSEFSIGEIFHLSRLCYIDNFFVTSKAYTCTGAFNDEIRVYHEKAGNISKAWKRCHVSSSLIPFETRGKPYLLEGCPICHMIRGYNIPEFDCTVFCEHVNPRVMCMGPEGTIFVFQREQMSIIQFHYHRRKFQCGALCLKGLKDAAGMCFSERYGIIVVLYSDMKTIAGVRLATRQVAWTHTEMKFGSPSQTLDIIKDVSSLPDGRVCVFHHKKIFALDPRDRTILYTLLKFDVLGIIWTIATCYTNNEQKLAVQFGPSKQTQILLFRIPFQSPEALHHLLLEDIIPVNPKLVTKV